MAFTPFTKGKAAPKKPGFVDSEMPGSKGKKSAPMKKPAGKKPGY